MNADFLEVFSRLGERKIPFLDERAHKAMEEHEPPLFLQSKQYEEERN